MTHPVVRIPDHTTQKTIRVAFKAVGRSAVPAANPGLSILTEPKHCHFPSIQGSMISVLVLHQMEIRGGRKVVTPEHLDYNPPSGVEVYMIIVGNACHV